MSDVSLRRRFQAWRVVVVATLVADAIVAIDGSHVAAITAMSLLIAMAFLLATTPDDAIVLPRGRSELIISVGTIGLYCAAPFPTASVRVALAIAGCLATVTLLIAARRLVTSAWWVALVAWNPIFILLLRG